jgi:hypothetical protein
MTYPNWTVLTPVPLIMNAVLDDILTVYPDVTFKFDPTLVYEESIRGVRAMRSAFDLTKQQVFPLFTFSMEVLKPYEIMRFQTPIDKDIPNMVAKQFKSRYCSFTINWRWYTTDIIASKTFEVMFLAQSSINQVKEVTLSLNGIGNFTYQVVWPFEGLASATYNKQDNLYMSVDGTAIVTGEFICQQDVDAKLIGHINLQLKDFINRTLVYDSATITPSGTVWNVIP